MNKIVAAVAAASMLLVSNSAFATDFGRPVAPIKPSNGFTQMNGKGNVGKFAVGLAIGAGLVGAAIAANRAQAYQQSYQPVGYGYGNGGMCRVWRADCRNGIESGCFKYERRC